ncbi:MAG TPA: LysM domain-containing protein [Leptospiraceae bacterium]|nr:LysM domain-containing protein [Leptospiraceae bacterium]
MTYTVKSGDTLMTYTVKSGDTLSGIAKAFTGDWTRWAELLPVNSGIKNPDASNPFDPFKNVIHAGLVLTIPAKWTGETSTVSQDNGDDKKSRFFIGLGIALIIGYFVLD